MNWLSFFDRSPSGQLARLRKKVREPHGEAANRINAAYKLLEMNTEEAFRVVLERFTIHVSPSRQDEEEKEDLLARVVEVGDDMVPPCIQFLKRERQVYWPVEALKRILSEDDLKSRLNEVLRYHYESPPASPDPKNQLIRALAGLRSEALDETIHLFLDDDDDDVLIAVLDYLFAAEEEKEREHVLEVYLRCEDRPRVRARILDRLVDKRWSVRGFRPKIEETLPEGYSLSREGIVKRVTYRG